MAESLESPLCVAFVDDDVQLLEGLRRLLRSKRFVWEMSFISSPRELLQRLERQRVDVVVSDMRMPELNGVALLREVSRISPGTIRIMLSGQAHAASWIHRIGPGHRLLAKPCAVERLAAAIEEACEIARRLQAEPACAASTALPGPPPGYALLLDAIERDAPLDELRRIALAESAPLSGQGHLLGRRAGGELDMAAAEVDGDVSEGLVLAAQGVEQVAARIGRAEREELAGRCARVAAGACAIARSEQADGVLVQQSAMAGLLHAIGRMLQPGGSAATARILDLEGEKRGARLAGRLLHGWGIPDPISEAVAFHPSPSDAVSRGGSPLLYVHAAWALDGAAPELALESLPLDWPYLERLQLAHRVPHWRDQCRAPRSAPVAAQAAGRRG